MNETMSLLLATTVLALGGLGLYMFKSSDEDDTNFDDDYNEDGLFSSFSWNKNDEDKDKDKDYSDDESEDYKPRKRTAKTQKNRKATGSSRRRY